MTPVGILSLCLLFVSGWKLAAADHADQCISPIICNGEPSWIETSEVIPTCPKPCENCDEEVKKAKDTIDGMMRELKEDFESVRKIVERHSTDVSTQQETTSSGSSAPTSYAITTDVTTQSSETTDSVSESISSTTDPDTSLATSIATTSEAATMPTTEAATISTSKAVSTTESTSVSESISPTTDPDTPVATSDDQTTQLAATTTKPTEVTTAQAAVTCAGIQWHGKGFWVNVTDPDKISYAKAAEICEEQNSHPANIYNSAHYHQVMTYLRPKIPGKLSQIGIWLGMTIDALTKVISLNNGTTTKYEGNWFPAYPSPNTSSTQIFVAVQNDPESKLQGMFNYLPLFTLPGVLCEIEE